jgi:Ca2+-binding RTX toxin-like protein
MTTTLTSGNDNWAGWFDIDDFVDGAGGNDTFDGGEGDDTLFGAGRRFRSRP